MSEFEKQWEEYVKTFPPQFESIIESFKPAIKRFWKAALEWVLGPAQDNCYESGDWYDNINEELEQLNQ